MTPMAIRRIVTAESETKQKSELSRMRHVNNWENADSEDGFISKGEKWIYFYIWWVLGLIYTAIVLSEEDPHITTVFDM